MCVSVCVCACARERVRQSEREEKERVRACKKDMFAHIQAPHVLNDGRCLKENHLQTKHPDLFPQTFYSITCFRPLVSFLNLFSF